MAWNTGFGWVTIPQGCKIFYPANYVALLDSINSVTNGDATQIVIQNDISDFVKQTDLSSSITDVAGLTYGVKKCYKIGNVITLSIQAQNNTGSSIAAGSTLFTLPNDAHHGTTYMRLNCMSGVAGSVGFAICTIDNLGNATNTVALNDGAYFWLNVSYAFA